MKNRRKKLFAVILVLCMIFPVNVVQAALHTPGEARMAEEDILQWKKDEQGTDQLLEGALLDQAEGSESCWFAFGVSRMGKSDNQKQYLARLMQVTEGYYEDLEENIKTQNPTDWYRMILTIRACGGDPENFGKTLEGETINLVQDGIGACIFQDPGRQGINGYIWALLALDSGDYTLADDAEWTEEKLVDAILEQELPNGGFGLTEEANVDITAMAVTALAPYCQENPQASEAVQRSLSLLSGWQESDGTMALYGERTAESTAWTLNALTACGLDPVTEEAFIKEGHTLLDGLELFRLADGSFIHSLDGVEAETEGNGMAGYQALYALEGYVRMKNGENPLFDLRDAPEFSEEEIERGKSSLSKPENSAEEKDRETVQKDTENRGRILQIAAGAAAVVLIGVLTAAAVKAGKKRKKADQAPEEDDTW